MTATAASDQQLALALQARPGSGAVATTGTPTLSRAARQTVPAFLQKLYEMVNEEATNDLIRWSDAGDSFFVYDQDRFAREVLGRWFKHQNFASFVRQLNMYGFHKIPHLQQGALRAQPAAESWQFEQPHFVRGQPDLLVLIQRKKQDPSSGARARASAGAGAGVQAIGAPTAPAALPAPDAPQQITAGQEGAGVPSLSVSDQPLDATQIVAGIQAVKRHQAAISTELAELRTANARLWAEAIAARERHHKHQDTIAKILKFLGTVFGGNAPPAPRAGSEAREESPEVVPRKRQRLMIEDRRGKKAGSEGRRMGSEPEADTFVVHPPTPEAEPRFATIDTPAPSETFSPTVAPAHAQYPFPHIAPSHGPNSADSPGKTDYDTPMTDGDGGTNHDGSEEKATSPPTVNALMPAGGYNNSDPMQAAINQLLASPEQMQRLLQLLSQQQQAPAFPLVPYPPALTQSNSGAQPEGFVDPGGWNNQPLLQFDQPWDPSQYAPVQDTSQDRLPPAQPQPRPQHSSLLPAYVPQPSTSYAQSAVGQALPLVPSPPRPDFPPGANADGLDVSRMQRNWANAAEIGADVDALQHHIDSLIASMGLNPAAVGGSPSPPPSDPVDPSVSTNTGVGIGGQGDDFDFDGLEAFMHDFQSGRGTGAPEGRDVAPEQVSAFLDEVASQASGDSASPAPSLNAFGAAPGVPGSPEMPAAQKARKRKSEAASLGVVDGAQGVGGTAGRGRTK